MSTNKIKISDLDFDQIKTNLKAFLTAQSEYTDYDFEGSGLSVLLDVLAYNTHYNAMYTNLAFNEMFLDSASKRNSVVSIANNFGYLPVSRIASRATINMVVPKGTSNNTTLVLPKYSAFSSTINGVKYGFYTIKEYSGGLVGTNFEIKNIQLVEGTPVLEKFTIFQSSDSMMMLNNTNIDTSTLKVTVQDVAESFTSTIYSFVDNMVTLTDTSKVYFVKETEDSRYKVYFGKNNLGYEPGIGSVVTIEYMTTSGSRANGIKLFSYDGVTLATGIGVPIITLTQASVGGKDIESNDEIKYNVSHKFRTQDRAVTADDYVSIIKSDNGVGIDAITCWGGETANPPVYGKVYIAVKPTDAYVLTAAQRMYIKDTVLKPKAVIGIYPELVDPEYIIVQLDVKFYFNANITNKSSTQLEALVRQSIADYNTNNLLRFGGALRQSRLSRTIDDTDKGITNSVISVYLRKSVPVVYNTTAKYLVTFNNPIPQAGFGEEYIISTGFYVTSDADRKTYYMDDDGLGSIRLFYYNEITHAKVVVNADYGSVDYTTGLITIYSAFITGLMDSELQFIITHRNENILAKYNQIVDIRPAYVNVTAIQENTQM